MAPANHRKSAHAFLGISTSLMLFATPVIGDTSQDATTSPCQKIELPGGRDLADFESMHSRYTLEPYNGYRIGNIKILVLPIFNVHDPEENYALYRFINGIHPPTRPNVIKQQLLFESGDTLDSRLLKESERILRNNSYLADAIVLPSQVCGDQLDIVVLVRELWTLLPKLFFSRKGGYNKYGLTLEDENLFGTGNTLFLQFINDRERDTTSVGYRTKHLFGTRIRLDATYSDTTDGINKKLVIDRPFYALNTPWSLGVNLSENIFEESLEAFDLELDRFDHVENEYTISGGYSTGLIDGYTQRYTLGFTRSEDLFEALPTTTNPLPANRILAYPWLQYAIVEDAFLIYRNLNVLYRTEDVPVGSDLSVLLGYADDAFNSKLAQWVFSLEYNTTPITLKKHLVKSSLSIEGNYDRNSNEFTNAVSSLDLSYYWLIAEQHRAYAGLIYDYGENLTSDKLLALGGEQGLRGYPSEYLLGSQRFLVTLEHRYFFKTHYLNLIRAAGVVFFDAGQTRYTNNNYGEDSNLLSSAGVGLRLNASKTSISRIVHLDLAFPLTDKAGIDEYQVRITSDATF